METMKTKVGVELTVKVDGDASRNGHSQIRIGSFAGQRGVEIVTVEWREPQVIAHRIIKCRDERVVNHAAIAPPN